MRKFVLLMLIVWVAILVSPVQVRALEFPDDGAPPSFSEDSFWPPDDVVIEESSYPPTSAFMIGDVAVGIIMPESDGSIDPSTEDWTDAERALVLSKIAEACEWWAAREPRANLHFLYEDHVVPTGYEPINHSIAGYGELWIGEVMLALGYDADFYLQQVHDYNSDLRQRTGTDWAFTIFVADSSNDRDGCFQSGACAMAIPGHEFVMTYDDGSGGPYRLYMEMVAAHEMGHIFGALDQYASKQVPCWRRSGYLDVENQNSEYAGGCLSNVESIMRCDVTAYGLGAVDYYARGQVGWWDSNDNGILDPVDTDPWVTLNAYTPNPTGGTTAVYTGNVVDIPWDSPTYPDETINTITRVEYRVNNGGWRQAASTDGAFNSEEEGFTFTLSSLAAGRYNVEVRAVNSVGKVSSRYAFDSVVVSAGWVGPFTTITPYWPDPTKEKELVYTGAVRNVGTTSAIKRVEYRVDSGSWNLATASDGAFNSPNEEFAFTLSLENGTHTVEVRAVDSANRVERYPAWDIVTVKARSFIFLPLVRKVER